jgi:hypothetical protein
MMSFAKEPSHASAQIVTSEMLELVPGSHEIRTKTAILRLDPPDLAPSRPSPVVAWDDAPSVEWIANLFCTSIDDGNQSERTVTSTETPTINSPFQLNIHGLTFAQEVQHWPSMPQQPDRLPPVQLRNGHERRKALSQVTKELMAKPPRVLIAIARRYFVALPVGRQRQFSSRNTKFTSLHAYIRALAYRFIRDCWRRRRLEGGPALLSANDYILIAQISASADSAAGDWMRNKPLTELLREQKQQRGI